MTEAVGGWLDHLLYEHGHPPLRTGIAIGLRRITAEQYHWLKHPDCTWTPRPDTASAGDL